MIQLTTLGGFQTRVDGMTVDAHLGRVTQRLLVYLLLSDGRVITRGDLVDLFYPSGDYQKSCLALNTGIWRLKRWNEKYLASRGANLISMRGEIALEVRDRSFFDRDEFIRLSEAAQRTALDSPATADARQLFQASGLYRGPFLQGDKTPWICAEREKLRIRYVRLQHRLMDFHRQRCEWEDALAHGRKLLEVDPLREDMHREMMLLYAQSGQRAAALRQFEEFRAIMLKECGLAPLPETFSLLEQVRRGVLPVAMPEGAVAAP